MAGKRSRGGSKPRNLDKANSQSRKSFHDIENDTEAPRTADNPFGFDLNSASTSTTQSQAESSRSDHGTAVATPSYHEEGPHSNDAVESTRPTTGRKVLPDDHPLKLELAGVKETREQRRLQWMGTAGRLGNVWNDPSCMDRQRYRIEENQVDEKVEKLIIAIYLAERNEMGSDHGTTQSKPSHQSEPLKGPSRPFDPPKGPSRPSEPRRGSSRGSRAGRGGSRGSRGSEPPRGPSHPSRPMREGSRSNEGQKGTSGSTPGIHRMTKELSQSKNKPSTTARYKQGTTEDPKVKMWMQDNGVMTQPDPQPPVPGSNGPDSVSIDLTEDVDEQRNASAPQETISSTNDSKSQPSPSNQDTRRSSGRISEQSKKRFPAQSSRETPGSSRKRVPEPSSIQGSMTGSSQEPETSRIGSSDQSKQPKRSEPVSLSSRWSAQAPVNHPKSQKKQQKGGQDKPSQGSMSASDAATSKKRMADVGASDTDFPSTFPEMILKFQKKQKKDDKAQPSSGSMLASNAGTSKEQVADVGASKTGLASFEHAPDGHARPGPSVNTDVTFSDRPSSALQGIDESVDDERLAQVLSSGTYEDYLAAPSFIIKDDKSSAPKDSQETATEEPQQESIEEDPEAGNWVDLSDPEYDGQ